MTYFEKIFNNSLINDLYFEPYLIFNDHAENSKNCLFIFPPGDGGAESYLNNIVPFLNERKIVLFNNIFLHILKLKLFNIGLKMSRHMIASFYINLLKLIQPSGPYNFVGWCFGGTLAFEICRILKDKYNDVVHNLFLIDSPFNIVHRLPIKSSIDNFYDFESNIFETETKVFLFKPLTLISEEYKYFFNTKANFFDKLMDINQIIVLYLDEDHDFWIKNKHDVIKITNNILKATSSI